MVFGFLKGKQNPGRGDTAVSRPGEDLRRAGSEALAKGDLTKAERAYREAHALFPGDAGYILSLGFVLYEMKQPEAAADAFERALELDGQSADACYFLGKIDAGRGAVSAAAEHYRLALARKPRFDAALDGLINLLAESAELATARQYLEEATQKDPTWLRAFVLLGLVCAQQQDWAAAIATLEEGAAVAPGSVEVLLPLLKCLVAAKEFKRAEVVSQNLLLVAPTLSEAHEETIRLYMLQGVSGAALDAASAAVLSQPGSAVLHHLLGVLLQREGRAEDAIAAFRAALEVDSRFLDSRLALAALEASLLRYDEATASMREVVRQHPDTPFVLGHLALAEWSQLQWDSWEHLHDTICARIREGQQAVDPFNFLLVSDSLELQRRCASLLQQDLHSGRVAVDPCHARIRLAYLSPDFRNHAVSFLMAGVIEAHDREQFEVYGVTWGSYPEDAMRQRMQGAFDRFVDISFMTDDEAASSLRDLGIDIAIDLTGYTTGARAGLFARRVAPIQVNYLGYPATMGVPYLDYIIADHYIIPRKARDGYAEQVAYLPTCFQANDDRRGGMDVVVRRSDFGLPENVVVFCSFHSTPKVTPAIFDVWMRLLAKTPGSVLWILCNSPTAKVNLIREAKARGIGAERLVIASDVNYEMHLARHRLADLFLDTLPFNAGTSASDALWAGLPVVTCSGEAFAARMAGSLLSALGLPELITTSLSQYEALAARLANDRVLLKSIRDKLWRARESSGLFSSRRVSRELEAAFLAMYAKSSRNEPPSMIDLAEQ